MNNLRLRKFIVDGSYLILTTMLVLTACDKFPGGRALGAVIVGGASLLLLVTQLPRVLQGYYDWVRRGEIFLPMLIGLVLAVLVLWHGPGDRVRLAAGWEVAGWLWVVAIVAINRCDFVRVGDGLLAKDVWVNPTDIRPGDLYLTSGMVSRLMHNAIGHVEMVVRDRDGVLRTVTSLIPSGVVLDHVIPAVCQENVAGGGLYIIARPATGFSDAQNAMAVAFSQTMLRRNKARTARDIARLDLRLNTVMPNWLCQKPLLSRVLPAVKSWLRKKLLPTGYDSLSVWTGIQCRDLYTCNSAVQATLVAAKVPVDPHETGFLGLGTGLGNPPSPAGFMADPHFRLLTQADRRAFEAVTRSKR